MGLDTVRTDNGTHQKWKQMGQEEGGIPNRWNGGIKELVGKALNYKESKM